MRPTREQIAEQRANAVRFLAANPTHELAPMLRVFLGATVPPTKDEAIPVMVEHANVAGGWVIDDEDEVRAKDALSGDDELPLTAWEASIRAQWATLVHFYGGAK